MNIKSSINSFLTVFLSCVFYLMMTSTLKAQVYQQTAQKSDFWQRVRFGGGLGLNFGNNFTNINVAPSAVYQVNEYFAAGVGLSGSYVKQKNYYDSYIYGASIITLFNPLPEIQLSAELEQLRVNNTYTQFNPHIEDDFWNTALFLGAGYRVQNFTIGIRYNVLFKESNNVYSEAFLPFVRIYF